MTIEKLYNFIKSQVDNEVLKEKAKKITDKLANSYVISYPKSGRTWTSTLLTYYISKEKGKPIKKFRFEWNPFLHSLFKKYPNVKLTHDISHPSKSKKYPTKNLREKLNVKRYKKKNIVFLIRNPRNIIESLYHDHYTNRATKLSLLEFTKHETYGIKRIIEFYNAMASKRSEIGGFNLITYENLYNEPEKNIERLFLYLGFESVNKKSLKWAIEEASLEKQKKKEKRYRKKRGASMKKNDFRVRKGGEKKEMSTKTKKYINEKIKEELDSLYSRYY